MNFRLIYITIAVLSAPFCHAWTITYWHDLANTATGRYWSLNGDTPTTTLRYLAIPNLSTGPKIYFCLEHLAIPANRLSASPGPLNIHLYTRQYNVANEVATTRAFAGWSKIASSLTSTFPNYSSNWSAGNYRIMEPQSPHSPRVYATGHRVYGWFSGKVGTTPNYLSLDWTSLSGGSGNVGSVKITLSDQNLYELQEPEAIALPVTSPLGDPTITAQGLADKLRITSPIPASYTLNWSTGGATSFTVSGGAGNGLITPIVTSGTSKALTNVPVSTQTYTLTTQSNANIAWQMSAPASWNIMKDGVSLASGASNNPTLSVPSTGTYLLRINGIDKLAEDEVINVTPAFLKRSKTVEVTIGNP